MSAIIGLVGQHMCAGLLNFLKGDEKPTETAAKSRQIYFYISLRFHSYAVITIYLCTAS